MDMNTQRDDSIGALFPSVIREGITKDELVAEYDKWATNYDKDLEKADYGAYQEAARKMCELFPPESRGKIRILDIGAGTGLLGQQIREKGFTRIDGLDPSKDMMAQAKKKGVYEKYFIECITEKPLAIARDTYDAIIGAGMFGYSLVPYTALHEMIRLTKPGGYVVLSFRTEIFNYAEYAELKPTMESFEKEGKWTKVGSFIYPNFIRNCEGILLVFQLL